MQLTLDLLAHTPGGVLTHAQTWSLDLPDLFTALLLEVGPSPGSSTEYRRYTKEWMDVYDEWNGRCRSALWKYYLDTCPYSFRVVAPDMQTKYILWLARGCK